MKYLLDRVVLSEPAKPRGRANRGAIAWLQAQDPLDLAISVLTLGEIRRGVDLLADGRRKRELVEWLSDDLPAQFDRRVLPVCAEVALAWGSLTAVAQRQGRPLHVVDGLLLATAQVHGLAVVTRNADDFEQRGIPVENPYSP
ncbi:MAG: type II toxin-antitoxin system VapC family toxin [Gemmatimonadales bacterium]